MKTVLNAVVFAVIFLSIATFSYARDDRGGGRVKAGGGGRGDRGGRSQSERAHRSASKQRDNRPVPRTPSMSRENFGRDFKKDRGGQRPQQGQRPAQQLQKPDRDAFKKRWDQNRNNRKPVQTNPELSKKKMDDYRSSYKNRWDRDRKYSHDTRKYLNKRYPNYRHWFDNRNWRPRYWNDRVNWWRGADWYRVNRWLGWGAVGAVAYPIYYDDYGYPVQLNYDMSQETYVNNNYVQPAAPADAQADGDWLPLGVFAVGSSPQEAAYSTIFMQLAADKQGNIAGTYYNSATNQTFEMDGDIDPQTQIATWQISEGASPAILATGIYNLTQDVVSVQVTFPGGSVQTWTLVRVDDSPVDGN